jgi:hypothetical protein
MAAILSPHGLYGGNRKSKILLLNNLGYKPLKGCFGSLQIFSIRRMPGDHSSRRLDASLAIPTRVLRFEASGALWPPTGHTGSPNRSGRFWPDNHAWSSASALWLSRVTQWFSGEPPQTGELDVASANHHSLLGSHKVLARPWFCGSTKKPSTDFNLLFLPPWGPHLTPPATGSLEQSLLVFSTPGGLTGNDLSCLFFTCTNTSQATTCTCNT